MPTVRTDVSHREDAEHAISWVTAARCLDDMGYSLQANRKSKEGQQHADRDAQFRYIHRQVKARLRGSDPVISVDAKLVGRSKNAGRTWRPKPQGQHPKISPAWRSARRFPTRSIRLSLAGFPVLLSHTILPHPTS